MHQTFFYILVCLHQTQNEDTFFFSETTEECTTNIIYVEIHGVLRMDCKQPLDLVLSAQFAEVSDHLSSSCVTCELLPTAFSPSHK